MQICKYVTQHDKTHKNVPEIKNELLVSYERATREKIISIMHSVGKLRTLQVEKQ